MYRVRLSGEFDVDLGRRFTSERDPEGVLGIGRLSGLCTHPRHKFLHTTTEVLGFRVVMVWGFTFFSFHVLEQEWDPTEPYGVCLPGDF